MRKAKEHGKLIYNGKTHRLNRFKVEDNKLNLDIGPLEYKERLGLFLSPGYYDLPDESLSKGLFSSATVRTTDGKYLMVELSGKSMNTEHIDFIGGIVERDPEIVDGSGIFHSFFLELHEEAYISEDDIDLCQMKHMVQDHKGEVACYFEVQLNVSWKDLVNRYEDPRTKLDQDIACVRAFDREEYLNILAISGPTKKLIGQVVAM